MSAIDKAKEAVQQIGHRVEETITELKHEAAHSGDRASEATRDAHRHAKETATTASHVAGEQAQQAHHAGESLIDKTAHALGIHK
ncbi:hypothetical protein HaLaN_09020 [Haematococcus lacustris]|uniref:Uncharacterized protein n=1 Tax=Haematococcus lacustris TaxID=44745 RepID=A0A699Z0W3_HAELA|nr:hypothetical protein QJQ45_012589 [Haematococcus lacustris]GFH13188.1 hypothetical protein HaLaN_09020 [Haematococcus lacustris]